MKWTYVYDFDNYDDNYDLFLHPEITFIKQGDPVLVCSRTNIVTGKSYYELMPQYAESGYPGNMDRSIRKFHGWRGTTNDISVDALGVYAVKTVERNGGKLKIVLNKTDLKRYED